MHSRVWALIKSNASPAGNRTLASRVTGGDTNHYTTEDLNLQFRQFPFYVKDMDTKVAHPSVTNKDCRKHPLNSIPVDIIKYSLQYTEYTPPNWVSVDKKYSASLAGNRTPASRVTGGDTNHYTTEDLNLQFRQLLFHVNDMDTKEVYLSVTYKDCRKHPVNSLSADSGELNPCPSCDRQGY